MECMFNKLSEAIKKHSNIIIMTHKNPDLDGMGSSIALYKIVDSMQKECYIIKPYKQMTNSLEKGLEMLDKKSIYINYKYENEIDDIINDNTLLIVLDTQKPELVESKELLEKVKNIFVIDHHMDSNSHINNCIFEYINSTKSSISEIIVNYYKYLNKKIDSIVATILLTGIETDTSFYNIKTSEDTFNASAFLLHCGANINDKKYILKMQKETYIKRQGYIKNSEFIDEKYAICMIDDIVADNVELAIISNELIKIEGIEASFTIGKLSNDIVGVSARSIGNVNVGKIMTNLGGGGHISNAAAQIKNKSVQKIKKNITTLVMEG